MEEGYYPRYYVSHIQFGLDDNIAVVDYLEGVLSIRIFYSIDDGDYSIFLEASNSTMSGTSIVKPVIMDNRKSLMFSFEMLCFNPRDFRKYFPAALEQLRNTIRLHKEEMRKMLLAEVAVSGQRSVS